MTLFEVITIGPAYCLSLAAVWHVLERFWPGAIALIGALIVTSLAMWAIGNLPSSEPPPDTVVSASGSARVSLPEACRAWCEGDPFLSRMPPRQ